MFGIVMESKLKNIFQCLIMLWKMSWKIAYYYFFFKFIKIIRNKSYKLKKLNENGIKKKSNFIKLKTNLIS